MLVPDADGDWMKSVSRAGIALGCLLGVTTTGAQVPQTTLSGVAWVGYRYELGVDSSLAPPGHANEFEVERAYITLRSHLGSDWSARITTDIDGRDADANQLSIRLKYAYLAWNPGSGPLTWKLGMIQTPLIGMVEDIWGYRMQGSVAMNRAGYMHSADLGASVAGDWNDGAVTAMAGVYNGEGFDGGTGDHHKDAAAMLSVRLAGSDVSDDIGGLRLTGTALYGRATGGGIRQRLHAMLAWHQAAFAAGLEFGITRDSIDISRPDVQGRVLSAFARYDLPSNWGLIARVDHHDPDTDISPDQPDLATGVGTRVIAGVARRLSPAVRVLLNADLLSLQHGSPGNSFDAGRKAVMLRAEFVY